MFPVVLVYNVFVCLSVGNQHYSKSCEQIAMKCDGGVQGGTVKKND